MVGEKHLRIIVIDDNPEIHQDFKKILKTDRIEVKFDKLSKLMFENEDDRSSSSLLPSFQIDSASQGIEGVERIKQALQEGNPYSLAFVDIRMPPGWDGIETIKHIWALDKEIQVVICTAYSDYSWEETIEKLGLTDSLLILKKPFDSIAVRQLACALTKKWQLMQDVKVHTNSLEKEVQERTDSLQKTLSLVEYQATHDNLTGLPNRVLLLDRIQQEIARANRNKSMFIVIFVDLDRFKLVNDSFSHQSGDELLIALSERLRNITRIEDTIARLSGDEFILISLQSIGQIEAIADIASKILKEISGAIKIANRDIIITASLGISIYPQDGSTPEELLRNADLAMYRAKSLGGNQFQLFTKELNEKCLARLEKESDLHRALLRNEFFLEYQPQYDMKNKKLIGVEALIRWQHPKYGVLLPMDFIPLAEDTGLIIPIGEWLLQTACAQNKSWQNKGIPPFRVAVNVATKQFTQPNFANNVKTILENTGLEAKYLEIEVTENVIISNTKVTDTLKELNKYGVNIALDDFGTGNSGLSYLHDLPFNQLKIDRVFIHNINNSERDDDVIIRAIIAMANGLNLDVVAEGVETKSQLYFLESQDCHQFQGYYFSKPVSANKIEKLASKYGRPP